MKQENFGINSGTSIGGGIDTVILGLLNLNAREDYYSMSERFKKMVAPEGRFIALFIQLAK